MADINIEKICNNAEVEKIWYKQTIAFIKAKGYGTMLDKFMDAATEVARYQNPTNRIPSQFFKDNPDIKITEIADSFGVKPIGKKLRVCPFHNDKDPSLSLSDEKGVFNCFGCGVKGNIIKFNSMLKKLKEETKDGDK